MSTYDIERVLQVCSSRTDALDLLGNRRSDPQSSHYGQLAETPLHAVKVQFWPIRLSKSNTAGLNRGGIHKWHECVLNGRV